MSYGTKLKEALKATHTEQSDIAEETHYSQQSVSAWVNDKRDINAETLPKVATKLDYPDFYLATAVKATDGVSIPVLDGDYVDRHPAAMKDLVQIETNEALDKMGQASMIKPIRSATESDKEEMKRVIKELLDAACSMINMIAVLCREYEFSMKDIYRSWFATLKARRMRK